CIDRAAYLSGALFSRPCVAPHAREAIRSGLITLDVSKAAGHRKPLCVSLCFSCLFRRQQRQLERAQVARDLVGPGLARLLLVRLAPPFGRATLAGSPDH